MLGGESFFFFFKHCVMFHSVIILIFIVLNLFLCRASRSFQRFPSPACLIQLPPYGWSAFHRIIESYFLLHLQYTLSKDQVNEALKIFSCPSPASDHVQKPDSRSPKIITLFTGLLSRSSQLITN